MSYRVELAQYEGPIELLLYLVRQDELDIMEIPIARITEEYLHHLKSLRKLHLEEAADFILVAAILLRLKLSLLLPREEEPVDLPDAKVGLHQILGQFAEYRAAAYFLYQLSAKRRESFPRGGRRSPEYLNGEGGNLSSLIAAFQEVLRRTAPTQIEIPRIEFHITDYIELVRTELSQRGKQKFREFLERCRSLTEAIFYFLAILELSRLGELSIHQDQEFGEIYLGTR